MKKLCGSGVLLVLIGALAAFVAHAMGLDTLIATNGTVTQGNLVFSNFGTSLLTNRAAVDVAGFTSGGDAFGFRFSRIPGGTGCSASTRGGSKEVVVDSTFSVTVSGSSSLIHGFQRTLDPASTVTGRNAIVRSVASQGRESK